MSQNRDLPATAAEAQKRPRDAHVKLIELFFFAYRDFTGDADALLAELGFGRAHHRVLHFANRTPRLTVAELLDILKITKQSLARVLKDLIDSGHIYQVHGAKDRRQRELHLSQKGRELTASLTQLQSERIASALDEIGWENTEVVGDFLKAMVDQDMRGQINARHGDEHGRSAP